MPLLQCKRCLDLHGPGCAATHQTDAGDPTCVFCLDDLPCPIQRKRQRSAMDQKAETTETPAANTAANLAGSATSIAFVHRGRSSSSEQSESGVTTMKTPETDANIAPKICKRPGCETQLSSRNRVGLCPRHVRWTGTSEQPPNAGNGHAAAAANGSGPKANGHALKAPHEASPPANGTNGAAAVLPELALDRVDHLIASIPAADKARLAFAWLKGEL